MPSRKLKFLCFNDSHLRTVNDASNVKGEVSSQRQAIQRMLEKKVVHDDGRKFATFMLAEAPKAPLFAEDEWEEKNLQDRQGRYIVADKDWLAEREKRIEADSARKAEYEEKAKDLLKQDVAGKLTDLIGLLNAPKPPAKADEKKGDKKADEKKGDGK